MPRRDRLHAVVLGAGLMGRWHAHAIRAAGVQVAAIVDTNAARARALAERYGARPVTDPGAALALRPDAVHVCTPPDSHLPLAMLALDAGAHVLVEKPLARSEDETRRVLDHARAQGRLACPVHQFLYQDGVGAVLGRRRALGTPLHVDIVACSAGAEGDPLRREQTALEILPHAFALLCRLCVTSLDDVRWQVASPQAGEVRVHGVTGGTTVSILVSLRGRPTRNTLRVVAERGTAHADLFHGFATFESGAVSRARKITRPFTLAGATLARATANLARRAARREPAYPGLRELTRRFYQAASGHGTVPIPPAETLAVARAVDRVAALVIEAGAPAATSGAATSPPSEPPARS